MSFMRKIRNHLLIIALMIPMFPVDAIGQEKTRDLPIDDSSVAVLKINLEKLDASWLVEQLGIKGSDQRAALETIFSNSLDQLKDAQVRDVFAVYPPVVSNEQFQLIQPYVVFPAGSQQQAEAVKKIIDSNEFLPGLNPVGISFVRNNLVISGSNDLQRKLTTQPSARQSQQFEDTLQSSNAEPISLLIAPSENHKKVLRDVSGAGNQHFAGMDDVRWIRADVHTEDSAIDVQCALVSGVDAERESARFEALIESLAKNIFNLNNVKVRVTGSQNGQIGMEIVSSDSHSSPFSQLMRNAITSPQKTNIRRNLKSIGIATHNFHDRYSSFPPSASYSANGEPLLSWRVHLLPFLGERKLYNEFHLDEPWDSPNNSQLIHRIPAVFRSHRLDLALAGKTTIVVPKCEEGLFSGETGKPIQENIDGTSNTILAIDAPKDQAVIWTKPGDADVDWNQLKSQIFGDREGADALFADGSARLIPATIPKKTLKALITRAGREVIEPF